MTKHSRKEEGNLLGDFKISPHLFVDLSKCFKAFQSSEFQSLNDLEKKEQIHRVLCDCIRETPTPCFLLPAVLDFLKKVEEAGIVEGHTFYDFELWLNQFSHFSFEENYAIRAKIAGKSIPREGYQTLFPIGMGKIYPGSHFVTAHGSPDLDTTIASFWGWLDAFAARVSHGVHLWNVPGGAPPCSVEMQFLFYRLFGDKIVHHLAKTRTTLSLSGLELLTQTAMVRKSIDAAPFSGDHDSVRSAVVVVDARGYYLDDLRYFDAEGVSDVILLFSHCLRGFRSHLQSQLISLFAKQKVHAQDLSSFVEKMFLCPIEDLLPIKEFSAKQKAYMQSFLVDVLRIKKGIEGNYEQLALALQAQGLFEFQSFMELIQSLPRSSLFDGSGKLEEDRPQIFKQLEKIIEGLDTAIQSAQSFVEKTQIALEIKSKVFETRPQFASYRDDVEEMRNKMGSLPYLTVTAADSKGRLLPLGVIFSHDLHRPTLGTVSLRDFCNREETKIPSYLEVISVIDHHKTTLQTASVPVAMIADAQSSNVLCAELSFAINDAFSLAGMSVEEIEQQLVKAAKHLSSVEEKKEMQRLLQRGIVSQKKGDFFIDPTREFIEYLHFLFGILDDTDLLTKVSPRDLACVVRLLNRMKSLVLKREVELISLEDIPQDKSFVTKASQRILQNADMYSLYQKIYAAKEEISEENIVLCAQGKPSTFFADTKVQNGCARVGQAKLFPRNYPVFAKWMQQLRHVWHENLIDFWKGVPEVDLHLQMISTVPGAEDLYRGKQEEYDHLDELWIWSAFDEQSVEHLKSFLNAFKASPQMIDNALSLECYGEHAQAYAQIFSESFLPIEKKTIEKKQNPSIAVLKYRAGSLNSRKAMISPYLPKLA